MTTPGRYCRAYLAADFRSFSGWPAELADDAVFFLHEDLVVTQGHRRQDRVVFESRDQAWRTFCTEHLGFALPPEVQAIGV